jgi:hypothetical protein
MAKSEVHVVIADLPKVQQLIRSLAALISALGKCEGLPEPVMTAADQVRLAVAALGGKDAGPPPDATDEEKIRDAMAEASDYPGRIVTR